VLTTVATHVGAEPARLGGIGGLSHSGSFEIRRLPDDDHAFVAATREVSDREVLLDYEMPSAVH
jgi:hypothetical protein